MNSLWGSLCWLQTVDFIRRASARNARKEFVGEDHAALLRSLFSHVALC